MRHRAKQISVDRLFFAATVFFCALLSALVVYLAVNHGGNDMFSFSEPVEELTDGWVLTDSEGNSQTMVLPKTIEYGKDGVYTLSRELPVMSGLLVSPALRFYSNYVDVKIYLDGEMLYDFPKQTPAFSDATGNTYHFVRLPADYAGKTVAIEFRCQLGDDITYLLNPPLIGSKGTMLERDVMKSLPFFTVAGCMCVLASGLGVLYFAFRKRFKMNFATLYTALFSLLFAVYVYFETSFAQILMPNGYLLCYTTLSLLALLPVPLLGVFIDSVSSNFKRLMLGLMLLCSANFVIQTVLNFAGVKSLRVMLPATHAVIIITISCASVCMLLSDKNEKPRARRTLMSSVPMIVGGVVDILLLNLERPSLNNSLWFTVGVMIFIIHQLYGYILSYFELFRTSLEAKLLTDMAYWDTLAGIHNRNAYEQKLRELSVGDALESLCCIVADINDLKRINDTLGHSAGDAAIAEVGATLVELMPESASFFRTGGDEFVVLLKNCDAKRAAGLALALSNEAAKRGVLRKVPISLAVGSGQYEASDENVVDFIRRVDTLMYECKRKQKAVLSAAAEMTI